MNKKTGVRAQQAEQTRKRILDAAIRVFSRDGYAGGRIEQISKEAESNDRMIYYYFTSKENLFVQVLEHTYEQFNIAESQLVLNHAEPLEALRTLIRFIWNYYVEHPEFVTILSIENLHRGRHSEKSGEMARLSGAAMGVLRPVIEAGQTQGLFRPELDLKHVYLMIASLCYFYNSNVHTLSSFLGEPLANSAQRDSWLTFITEQIVSGVICVTERK